MTIPFVDLKTQFKAIENDIRKNIDKVLAHGKYVMGPEIAELESRLAQFAGVKHVVSCSSGTDALLMPLMAWGVEKGDAVFTTPFTFFATAEVIGLLGATPVFVDVDPSTYNIDPENLERAILEIKEKGNLRPRAVIPVDLFGLPAEYDAIGKIALEHDILVLEDAAQSLGAEYMGRKTGSFGHAAATSFFPAKPLGCYGDGGAVFTNDDKLAESLASIRVHGQGRDKYENVRIGLNARMDSIQAAVLMAKLGVFPEEMEKRRNLAKTYSDSLAGLVETPSVPDGMKSAWAQYSILCEKRDRLREELAKVDIPTVVYYQKPLHIQPAFDYLGYKPGSFPVSEELSGRILSLPMNPYMTREQAGVVIDAVRGALNEHM